MAISWSSIRPGDPRQASESILASDAGPTLKGKGISVQYKDQHLPAKQVLDYVHQIANGHGSGICLDLGRGEGSIRMLRPMEFFAGRVAPDGLSVK